jgi:cytochrome c oxidase accessory protein FixG
MCPYARFQSAMFDKDTLIVGYDVERGEPRGSRSRKADRKTLGKGDCIDCGLCVQVCPTGIDIRKGLQYECISCTACIDVCDGVMDKMGYPRGLIRFDTQNGMAQHLSFAQRMRRVMRPRVLVYTTILLLLVVALGTSIALRSPFRVDVVRDRGSLARIVDNGQIENVYRLQVMNRSEEGHRYSVAVAGLPGLELVAEPVSVGPTDIQSVVARVRLAPQAAQALAGRSVPIVFELRSEATGTTAAAWQREDSTFFVPR